MFRPTSQYHSTVLTAFQNVADTLNALQQDADGLKAAAASKDAAAATLDLAKSSFRRATSTIWAY